MTTGRAPNRPGKPFDGLAVRIVAPDGRICGPDGIGAITVRGFSLPTGHCKDPVKTAEALRDGWFHTGDLGSPDADGSLMFRGWLSDMLKVGGETVAAQEIETLVGTHPAVTLCKVVGRPDARLAEVPVAFVELKPGAQATADAIIGFCTGRIASFKVPRDVRFVPEWPMSASRTRKFRLKAMQAEPLGPGLRAAWPHPTGRNAWRPAFRRRARSPLTPQAPASP
jgi:acyl-CoA synthetase (AMP-forming)/AMP-acid ligase II